MNKKQEAIQKAYGEHWEELKDLIDKEDGWVRDVPGKHSVFFYDDVDVKSESGDFYWRLKSLSGIESNNDWISVSDTNNLPKIDLLTEYWLTDGFSIYISTITLNHKIGRDKVTHYQPIIKPKLPIY